MVTQSVPEFSLWRRATTSPPGRRIRPEGADNYAKGRGTLHKVVFAQDSSSTPSSSSTDSLANPRPSPRCNTPAAKVNYELGVHGHVGDVLKGNSKARPSTAPARVKPEAAEIATMSRGSRMRSVLQEQNEDVESVNAVPRVKPEGKPIAAISKGKRMSTLIHEYGQHVTAQRQPRIRKEAQENAQSAKGGRMHSLIHHYGTGPIPRSERAIPRVRPEGAGNASLAKGAQMDSIIHQYGINQATPRTTPRVKREAETNAELGKGKRMASLLSPSSSSSSSFFPPPPSPARSSPRVKTNAFPSMPLAVRRSPRVRPEASQFAELDRGSRMAQLLHDSNGPDDSPRPPSRAVGEQAKRNLWHGVIGSVGNCLKQSGRKTCLFLPGQQAQPSPCVV